MKLPNLSILLLSRQDNLAIWSVNSCYATNRVNFVNVVLCSSRYPPLWNPVGNLLASGYFKRKLAFRTQSALGSRSATEDVVDVRHRLREIGVFSCLFTALPLWDPMYWWHRQVNRMPREWIWRKYFFGSYSSIRCKLSLGTTSIRSLVAHTRQPGYFVGQFIPFYQPSKFGPLRSMWFQM